MTYKQWTALVQLAGLVVVVTWLGLDALAPGAMARQISAVAATLLWAVGAMILFNIAAMILVSIVVSVTRGEALVDERADERDREVGALSMRNAYVAASAIGVGGLGLLAAGFAPVLAGYCLFAALAGGGAVDAVSRLYYYRVG